MHKSELFVEINLRKDDPNHSGTTLFVQVCAIKRSGQWNHCDSRIGNTGVTLRAQKQQLQINEATQLKAADKRSETEQKALEKARAVLVKYKFDVQSLTEKDWGNVVRWVLPEAKVPFLLKHLKKREQILAKLATLPNEWTTYIPYTEAVPIATCTRVE